MLLDWILSALNSSALHRNVLHIVQVFGYLFCIVIILYQTLKYFVVWYHSVPLQVTVPYHILAYYSVPYKYCKEVNLKKPLLEPLNLTFM